MSQGPLRGPESPAPLDAEPPELPLESKLLEPSPKLPSGVEVPLEPELLEPPLELEPPLDPEPTLESTPSDASLEPEVPPELDAFGVPESNPSPEPEEALDESPEPHAHKAAAMTEIAQGASARVEAFARTSGRGAMGCAIELEVTPPG